MVFLYSEDQLADPKIKYYSIFKSKNIYVYLLSLLSLSSLYNLTLQIVFSLYWMSGLSLLRWITFILIIYAFNTYVKRVGLYFVIKSAKLGGESET